MYRYVLLFYMYIYYFLLVLLFSHNTLNYLSIITEIIFPCVLISKALSAGTRGQGQRTGVSSLVKVDMCVSLNECPFCFECKTTEDKSNRREEDETTVFDTQSYKQRMRKVCGTLTCSSDDPVVPKSFILNPITETRRAFSSKT